jgi:glycosyltransferase involved in cell wall biosynthesis
MRILQINKLYHPTIGGIETIVKTIFEELNESDKFQVDVLACQEKGPRQIEMINGKNKVFKAASYGKKLGMPLSLDFFRIFFEIRKKYDLIIIHYPFPLAAIIFPFLPKDKLVIYYHSDIIRQKYAVWLFSYFIKKSLNRAKLILVAGNNIINSSPALKKRQTKCRVVPYGLNIEYGQEDNNQAPYIKQSYSAQKPFILSVGRLVYYKGFQYAIQAMSNIDAKLLIIGEGPQKFELEKLLVKHQLQEKVQIIPPQANLKPFFLACDLFIFPSVERSEAFGLVQLEAMAAGKPVINTLLQTGVEEVSIDGISGISVEAKNVQALNRAIKTLIDNPDLNKTYGANARKRYESLYTLEVFIENLKTVLKR